jgi:hypothetical protein
MNGRKDNTKYFDFILLPFMGEMARGQRGRKRFILKNNNFAIT